MKPETELLLSAAFVLTPMENWTQHVFARDKNGNVVMQLQDPAAVSFCALGALYTAGGMSRGWDTPTPLVERAELLLSRVMRNTVGAYNNTHTHADVLNAIYKAAELAEAE